MMMAVCVVVAILGLVSGMVGGRGAFDTARQVVGGGCSMNNVRGQRFALFAGLHFMSQPKEEKKRNSPFAAGELEAASRRAELATDLDWPESGSCPARCKVGEEEEMLHTVWMASERQNLTHFLSAHATHLSASSLASMVRMGGSSVRKLAVPPLSVNIAETLWLKWESEAEKW